MGQESMLRYNIDIKDINQINVNIEAYQRTIDFYVEYLEQNGEYDYIDERINALNATLAEYMIAREFSKEGCKTFD
jgi:hypothetical protein